MVYKISICNFVDQDELDYLDERIKLLEDEVLNPSLEEARSGLDLLQPKKDKVREVIQFEEQVNLPSSQTNPDSNSSEDTNVPNQEGEELW